MHNKCNICAHEPVCERKEKMLHCISEVEAMAEKIYLSYPGLSITIECAHYLSYPGLSITIECAHYQQSDGTKRIGIQEAIRQHQLEMSRCCCEASNRS